MSHNSNKRQRKAKLEPRECELEVIDVDEASCASSQILKVEWDTNKLLPKSEPVSNIDGTNDSETSQHKFAIDIEVETFEEDSDRASGEGCLNIDEECVVDGNDDGTIIENHSKIRDDSVNEEGLIKECTYYDIINDANSDIGEDNDIENNSGPSSMLKGQDICERVMISEDRLKEEIELKSQKTTSPVDKQIEILQKNNWCLPKPHSFNSHEVELEKALQSWKVWAAQSSARETILMYKCYSCNMGWWHLYPFREHIKHHRNILVSTESNCNEMNIIAMYGEPEFKQVKIEGECWQCQKSMEHFSDGPNKLWIGHSYHCSECYEKFRTCNKLKLHEGTCMRFLKQYYKNKNCEPTIQCEYCSVVCLTKEMFDHHLVMRHAVRSDLYMPQEKPKFHTPCGQTYIYRNFHVCEHTLCSTCPFCKVNFASSKQLAFHNNLARPMTCVHCKIYLRKECMLLDHLITHSETYMWLYVCKRCPNTFYSEQGYRSHRSHIGKTYHSHKQLRIIAPKYCLTKQFARLIKAEAAHREIEKPAAIIELESDGILSEKEEDNIEINIEPNITEDADNFDSDKEFEEMEQSIASTLNNFKDKIVTDENNDKNLEIVIENEPKVSIEVKTEAMSDEENAVEIDDLNDDELEKETALLEAELSKVFKASKTITGEVVNSNLFHEEINIKEEIKEEEDEDYEDDIIVLKTDAQFSYSVKTEVDVTPNENIISSTISTSSQNISHILNKSVTSCTSVKKDLKQPKNSSKETASVTNKVGNKSDGKTKNKLVEIKTKHKVILNFEPDTIVKTENDMESQDDDVLSLKSKSEHDFSEEEWDCVRPKKIKLARIESSRIYKCVCEFSGKHKEYKAHVNNECKYTRRKYRRKNPTLKDVSKSWKNYKCSRCLTDCNSLNLYLHHLGVHGLPTCTCPKCGLQMGSESMTINHVTYHIKSNFIRLSVIKSREVVTSRNDFVYQCTVCQATVEYKNFFAHWEMHLEFNKEVKIATVKDEMHEYSKSSSSNVQNVEKESTLEEKLLQKAMMTLVARPEHGAKRSCVVCEKKFDRSHDLKIHIIQHLLMDAMASKNGINGLICQICQKTLKNPATFKEHLRHHGSLPVYRCVGCNKSFSDSSNFAKHKKIHNLMVLICDICQKKFRSKAMLIQHIQNHMATGTLECDVCKTTFHSESALKKHYRKKHENFKTKFKCIVCKIAFDCLKLKWDHMWHVHKIRKVKADCPICGWSSRKLSDIRTHLVNVHNKPMTKSIRRRIFDSRLNFDMRT